ncbi:DUF1801 domain-containing protein [bacterium]|nr:DUF1801 domain-containing protein [bacterium]
MDKKVVTPTVEEYILRQTKSVQEILRKIQDTIRNVAPGGEFAISYQIICYKTNGKYSLYFGAWKTHIGMYPTPEGDADFREDIEPYRSSKSTLKFLLKNPIPYNLIEKAAIFRIDEVAKRSKVY